MTTRTVTLHIPLHTRENPDKLIPAGTYDVRMTWSPKFQRMMPEVMNVPGRTGIRLHKGTHSEGCLLMSDPEYTQFRKILETYEKVTISIA